MLHVVCELQRLTQIQMARKGCRTILVLLLAFVSSTAGSPMVGVRKTVGARADKLATVLVEMRCPSQWAKVVKRELPPQFAHQIPTARHLLAAERSLTGRGLLGKGVAAEGITLDKHEYRATARAQAVAYAHEVRGCDASPRRMSGETALRGVATERPDLKSSHAGGGTSGAAGQLGWQSGHQRKPTPVLLIGAFWIVGGSRVFRATRTVARVADAGGIRSRNSARRAHASSLAPTGNDALQLLFPRLCLRVSDCRFPQGVGTDGRGADAGWTPLFQICTGAPDDKGPAVFFPLHLGK